MADSLVWETIRAEIADEYAADHTYPWIIGFSGGKDSTLVTHLAVEHLLSIAPSERKRKIHIVANDTLVESPMVVGHIKRVTAEIALAAKAFQLPVTVGITTPDLQNTFWVNLIGKGYPSPNRLFRWCTDRMKIAPTSKYILEQTDQEGSVILLLGVRRSESSARASSVAKHDNGQRLNSHSDLKNCLVFRPIVELDTLDVWEFLSNNLPPWGGTHDRLIQLYRDAGGGECPVVTAKSDIPSCGTNSSRFGCWTCTVVEKDRSLAGFVDSGYKEFSPLIEFRDWLVEIRNDPTRRQARRRGGQFTITDEGKHVPGPFSINARAEILAKLLDVQKKVGHELIRQDEIELIRTIWAEDAEIATRRSLNEARAFQ